MSISDNDSTAPDEQSILAGGLIRGRVGPADAESDGQPSESNDVRSVEESRAEAAGDQDHAAETETDEDRTQGYS